MEMHLKQWGDSYSACLSTYAEVSLDKANNVRMVDRSEFVINFDEVSKTHSKELDYPKYRSRDALYIDSQGAPCFIEFKNGGKKMTEIREKVIASILLTQYFGLLAGYDDCKSRAEFILVDDENANRADIERHLSLISKEDLLPKVRNVDWLFKRTVRCTSNQFVQFFMPKFY